MKCTYCRMPLAMVTGWAAKANGGTLETLRSLALSGNCTSHFGIGLALFATYSYHGFITDRDGETLELEADHRRHAEIENAIRDLKYGVGLNHLPSGRFAANGAPLKRLQTARQPPVYPNSSPDHRACNSPTPPLTGVCKELLRRAWQVISKLGLGSGQGSGSSQTRLQRRPRCSNRRSQPMPCRITLTVRPGLPQGSRRFPLVTRHPARPAGSATGPQPAGGVGHSSSITSSVTLRR